MNKKQSKSIATYYDGLSKFYDRFIIPKQEVYLYEIIRAFYEKHSISRGTILDVGCGTGMLKRTLGGEFIYWGIDLSPEMARIANGRYAQVWIGEALEICKKMPDKSVHHIVAVGWLYMLPPKDFNLLLQEFFRIARETVCISCEQFDTLTRYHIETELDTLIYNHTPLTYSHDSYSGYLWSELGAQVRVYGECFWYDLRKIL
jgi:ubiquinone/menaquinone biosynthesis C-methylase UbiE